SIHGRRAKRSRVRRGPIYRAQGGSGYTSPPASKAQGSRSMGQESMKDFFISYTSADRRWAEWIAWHLEAKGYSVVIQAWDFRPGSNFVLEMDKASREAMRTLIVLSPNYLDSRYAKAEWASAF